MILYLLSYPRSGNSRFTSTIELWKGWSVYGRPVDMCMLRTFPGDTADPLPMPLQAMSRDSSTLYIIKTHEWPDLTEAPARVVYIARDGRDVAVSYAHYILARRHPDWPKVVQGDLNQVMTALVMNAFNEGWGSHACKAIGRIAPCRRIRFENINQKNVLALLADGLNIRVDQPYEALPFEKLKRFDADQFRRGKAGCWEDEMPKDIHSLFWIGEHNRRAMEKWGFGS